MAHAARASATKAQIGLPRSYATSPPSRYRAAASPASYHEWSIISVGCPLGLVYVHALTDDPEIVMLLPGHVLLDQNGAILEADEGFGALLLTPVATLRGRDVLSVTAPADRAECSRAIAGLHATGLAFDIVKRFIRPDDSVVWVRNSVSRMTVHRMDLIVATCTPVPEDNARRTPEALLHTARLQVEMTYARGQVGDPAILSGAGWPALLEVYIAEAEGRIMDTDALAAALGQNIGMMRRWTAALVDSGMLEVETRDKRSDTAKAYRLTARSVQRLEQYLATFVAPKFGMR